MVLLSWSYIWIIFLITCLCRITLSGNHSTLLAKRDASCGAGLTCGPDCQALCVAMHNYYRKLHDAPPMSCDPELAKSAQEWTDEQARAGNMHHSEWTDKFTESISWKGWGWEGMEKMEGAIPGATRGWYSEIKNDYNYATGKGNGQAVGHFMAVVWKGETKIGCGLNIKPDDGTYVTAHYAPASHANSNYFELAPKNVLPRKDPDPACDIRSSEREDCNGDLKAPFVTPEECLNAGCCYDDMFMSEPSVDFFGAEGRKWCFVRKGGAPAPTEAPGAKTTPGAPGVTEAPGGGQTTGAPGVPEAPGGGQTTGSSGVTEAPGAKPTGAPGVTDSPEAKPTAVAAPGGGQTEEWMNVGSCGQGLTCGPDCQLLCLKLHNYYRKLHDAPPMSCDPELAKSAQEWTDEQARAGNMHHSEWTDKFTESISWKGWGWEGMEKMEGAIPGATRGWYSEIKNDYNYATGKGNGQAVGHFMAVVWKGETKIGCGLNIKPDDGTYVTAHYAPASHANSDYFELAPKNVLPRKDPEPECDIRSSEREDCKAELKAPFVTPEECLNAGCCYDDMFMSEPSVDFFGAEGRKWCFVPKGGLRPPPSKRPGAATTGPPGVTEAPGGKPTGAPEVTPAPGRAPEGTAPSSKEQFTGKNTCYMLRLIGTSWKGGQEVCGGFHSGNLVSIETEGEFKYIKSLIHLVYNQYNNGWYIGLEKDPNKGKWKWVSGEPLTISYWAPNEPTDDGKYAMMSGSPKEGSPGAFTATDGQSKYGIICEYKSDGKCPSASLARRSELFTN